ncbi:MAG TPA: hypothetical protein VKF84_11305 [Candidatus Sulfotelmatobacter sp.]|nr:hypothetical protein [Candidatus Sulfotelmatobacter sp.]
MEFIKLAALALTIAGVLGTSLGFLVKFMVERGDASTNAINQAIDDIRQNRVVTLDEFVRDAHRKGQLA